MTLGVKIPNYAPGSDMHIPDQAELDFTVVP